MIKKTKLFLFLILIGLLVIGCRPGAEKSIVGKGIETRDAQEVPKVQEAVDPCDDLEFIQGRIASTAEEISGAEIELDGLKVDLEFAREDGADVAQIEELIQSQEEYITDLNKMMSDLQELIKEC